jgi:acetyl esterase/lipase
MRTPVRIELPFTPRELDEARATNRRLAWAPRFRPGGRLHIALLQGLMHLWQAVPTRQLPRMGVRARTRYIRWNGNRVALRILQSGARPLAIFLDIHGGGWVLGNAKVDDPTNGLITAECRMTVVSVDYRLALDNRLDLAIRDCVDAALWLIENAETEFGTRTIFIGGESAGAHLVACTLQRLKARGKLAAIWGAVLFYGVYDLSGTPSLRRADEETLVLHGPSTYRNLLRLTPDMSDTERRAPGHSHLYADLGGYPPALFLVGTLDPFIDDTMRMAERWASASGNAELVVVPQAPHAFNRLGTRLAGRTNAYVRQWLVGRLDGDQPQA